MCGDFKMLEVDSMNLYKKLKLGTLNCKGYDCRFVVVIWGVVKSMNI